MPDPSTLAQLFGVAVGGAIASAAFTIHKLMKEETERRRTEEIRRKIEADARRELEEEKQRLQLVKRDPLYENGERETIVDMIRKLRDDIRYMQDRMAELKRDSQDYQRVHRKIHERLESLECRLDTSGS